MSKPLRKDHKKTASKPTFNGWNTTDEDEIARRRLRASLDAMKIDPLEPDHPIYGTFSVRSLKARFENLSYSVEIRSLSEFRNSCTCPDYNVNGLGTCKHIEAVLAHVRRNHSELIKDDAASPRIEIYLLRRGAPEIRIAWPEIVPITGRRLAAELFRTQARCLAILSPPFPR